MTINALDIGTSPNRPIGVGGGIIFGAFNEQQYLQRLRGPNGEALQFTRIGSMPVEGMNGPIDAYSLSGLDIQSHVILYFDMYKQGPLGVPKGFTMERADDLLFLPQTVVREFYSGDQARIPVGEPRRWKILDNENAILGFVRWAGDRNVEVDMPTNTGNLLRSQLDHFVARTPTEYLTVVLEDFFQRFLPLTSGGLVRGVPMQSHDPGDWTGPVWGDETVKKERKRRFWFW